MPEILRVRAVSRVLDPEILQVKAVSRLFTPELLVFKAVSRVVLKPEVLESTGSIRTILDT